MRLAQYIPFRNYVINGLPVVENVFGPSFVVYDAMGVMHTTAKNLKLLSRAQELLINRDRYDPQGLIVALAELREEADILRQADYQRAVLRERLTAALSDAQLADSLE